MFPHRTDRTFLWATAGTAAVAAVTVYVMVSIAPPTLEVAARGGAAGSAAHARG